MIERKDVFIQPGGPAPQRRAFNAQGFKGFLGDLPHPTGGLYHMASEAMIGNHALHVARQILTIAPPSPRSGLDELLDNKLVSKLGSNNQFPILGSLEINRLRERSTHVSEETGGKDRDIAVLSSALETLHQEKVARLARFTFWATRLNPAPFSQGKLTSVDTPNLRWDWAIGPIEDTPHREQTIVRRLDLSSHTPPKKPRRRKAIKIQLPGWEPGARPHTI